MEIYLEANQPFNLASVIKSHGWVQMVPFSTDGTYSRLGFVSKLSSGRVLDLDIQEAPRGITVRVEEKILETERMEIEAEVGWMLGLDQDFSAFYDLAGSEPKLADMRASGRGRVLRCPTLFEDVIKTILTTNTLWAATLRMNSNLVSLYGEASPSNPDQKAFPTADRLASLDEAALRREARIGYRAPYVLGLARAVASGQFDLESLKTNWLPTLELRKQLMSIKGVGAYAAANLLMILGRYDFIPIDSWAIKIVSHEWNHGVLVEPAVVQAAFERWGEWKGLAFWFWDWSYNS